MPSLFRCVLVSATLISAVLAPAANAVAGQGQGDQQKSVLFLVAFRAENPAGLAFGTDLQQKLAAALGADLDAYTEYMDPARFPEPGYQAALHEFLRVKYADRPPDLIVAVDHVALEFLGRYRERAFPGTPVVYLTTFPARVPLSDATGIRLLPDFAGSLESALAVHPETTHVVVLTGASLWDRRHDEIMREQFARFEGRVTFTYLSGLPMRELLDRVSTLRPKTIIFFISYSQDRTGQRFLTVDAINRVTAAASVPTYAWVTSAIGAGILGGRIISLGALSDQMVALTLRVLKGENAGAIPEFRPDVFVTQFDWRQMNRWGIGESRLPAGSTILFREPTFWERYRTLAIATFLALALQGALIAGLMVQRARRRRSEIALRESEERFRLLADTAPMLVWTSDTDKQCTFFNARWLEFTGRTLEQELGSGWTECVHPEDRDECVRAYSTEFDARQPFSIEYRLRRADGVYRWVLDTGVPRFAADGSFSGYCGTCVDVEDYRKAQEALHESAERYRLATAAGAVGVWDWNTTTRELYVDPQLKRMLGYEDAEVPNRLGAVMSLVHPADVESLLSRLRDCLEGRAQDFHLEARMVHKDGRVRWIEMQGTAVRRANEEASRIVGTGSDITERKRAEIQLKENEAVLQANHREIQMLAGRLMIAQEAERTRIARDLHDDVSQELAALSISLGKMKRARGDAQGELSLLQLRAMTIAQNVRSLSHDLHPGILYHAGLVAALTAYCEELRGEHPVQVRCHANGDLTGVDQATKLCLYRVAQEALRNAVTHANARSVDVWLSQGSSGVELTITDDGQGFDIKARESGTGLGLISIGERVRLAGGTLSVVTELQKGTRVHVHVPAPKPVEAPAERT